MNDTSAEKLTFEQSLVELERIVRELEDGKTGLEEALARYEQGVHLLNRCHGQLRQSQQRILELTGRDADGNPLTRPFEHAPTVKEPKEPQSLFDRE